MSAPIPPGLLIGVMPPKKPTRQKQIEQFIHEHPERYTRVPAKPPKPERATVHEQIDGRAQLGDVPGCYRRRKHGVDS